MIKTVTNHLRRFAFAFMLVGGVLATGSAHAESLNCVQFVKKVSPVALRGNAHQWWDAAVGQYNRGHAPKPGAVMVFSKTRHLPYGHVAVVRSVRNSRTILVDHANWSTINGRKGHVERSARVVDISAKNDWSAVRVWYQPLEEIGQTSYAVKGFVYPKDAKVKHHAR